MNSFNYFYLYLCLLGYMATHLTLAFLVVVLFSVIWCSSARVSGPAVIRAWGKRVETPKKADKSDVELPNKLGPKSLSNKEMKSSGRIPGAELGSASLVQSVVPSVPDPHKTLKLMCYFFLWYFLTVVYNVSNKIVLNELPLPVTVCAVQLFLGIPVFLPIWILKRPKGDPASWWRRYSKIGLCHGLGNLASIMSFGAGAVSFTHVIKACEPVFAAVLSRFLLHTETPPAVYVSLIPIVLGVGIASAKELSFTWHGFVAGMASNLFYQLRIVLAKIEMTPPTSSEPIPGVGSETQGQAQGQVAAAQSAPLLPVVSSNASGSVLVSSSSSSASTPSSPSGTGDGLSPSNMFRVLTLIATAQLLPLALILEGRLVQSAWSTAVASGAPVDYLVTNLLISGVSYYLYNEVAFWILALVSPITHAIGNTVKRVVIIFASILILKTPINAQGVLGSAIAIFGTLVYSLVLQSASTDLRREKKKIEAV